MKATAETAAQQEQRFQYFDHLEHLTFEMETVLQHLEAGNQKKAHRAMEIILKKLKRYLHVKVPL